MKRFGLLIFCWLILILPAQATITASGTAAVCAVNSGSTITLTRNQAANNTVVVIVYVTNKNSNWVNTMVDTGGSAYTERVVVYSSVSEVLSIFSTPASGSLASTSITIGMETTDQTIACAFEYLGVTSFGNTAVNNDTSSALTVSVTTLDANNWVVGGFGQYSGSAALAQDVGTLRASLSNGTTIVSGLADNTCVSAGSCQVAVTSNYSAVWVAAGLELRSRYLFSDGFEGGNFNLWAFVNGDASINSNLTYVHSGSKSAQYYYYLNGIGDINVWTQALFTGNPDVHVRFYIYYKTPEVGETPSLIVQRKLFYASDSTDAGDLMGNYQIILNSWNTSGGEYSPTDIYLSWLSQGTGGGCGISGNQQWDIATLHYDTWYSVEFEMKLNTPGGSDGEVHLWINGIAEYDSTGESRLRGTCTGNLSSVAIGNQANITATGVIDEYRYWDDVVIDDEYIGVMGGPAAHRFIIQ